MEALWKSKDGRITFKVEGKDSKELFRGLAESQEVFDAESKCGACGSPEIHFSLRNKDGNEYFKLVCTKCSATFDFGQTKQGGRLFPKRKGKDGEALTNGGWIVWGTDREI